MGRVARKENPFVEVSNPPCDQPEEGFKGERCSMFRICQGNRIACWDFWKYTRTRDNGVSRDVAIPETSRIPTEEIYAQIYTNGAPKQFATFGPAMKAHIERYGGCMKSK